MEGVGNRLVPLALEEGQACWRHVVLVLSVEINGLKGAVNQRVAEEGRRHGLLHTPTQVVMLLSHPVMVRKYISFKVLELPDSHIQVRCQGRYSPWRWAEIFPEADGFFLLEEDVDVAVEAGSPGREGRQVVTQLLSGPYRPTWNVPAFQGHKTFHIFNIHMFSG